MFTLRGAVEIDAEDTVVFAHDISSLNFALLLTGISGFEEALLSVIATIANDMVDLVRKLQIKYVCRRIVITCLMPNHGTKMGKLHAKTLLTTACLPLAGWLSLVSSTFIAFLASATLAAIMSGKMGNNLKINERMLRIRVWKWIYAG